MDTINIPSKIELVESSRDRGTFSIEPCYPGYGTTIGNALRRVLLSSLPGAAVTAVRIDGVDHEFSTIASVKEDVVGILLNLKLLRFEIHGDEPVTMRASVKGDKALTGADFEGPSTVKVVNQKQQIATLTDKSASLTIEIAVGPGRGYLPVENREKEKLDVGWIAVDAVYTPVKTVNFTIDHVRVGQITNYDRITLVVETDGTIAPESAVGISAKILVDHFTAFLKFADASTEEPPKKKRAPRAKKAEEADAPTDTSATAEDVAHASS